MARGLLLVLRPEAIIVDATLEYRHCADPTDPLGVPCARCLCCAIAECAHCSLALDAALVVKRHCWDAQKPRRAAVLGWPGMWLGSGRNRTWI